GLQHRVPQPQAAEPAGGPLDAASAPPVVVAVRDHGGAHHDPHEQQRYDIGVHRSIPHESVLNRISPPGVRPPLLTTATFASATGRSRPSPRSWTTASGNRPMPWVRPWESCPPWVLSGRAPSRAMFLPPSRKSLASPMPQKPRASIQDRQLMVKPS